MDMQGDKDRIERVADTISTGRVAFDVASVESLPQIEMLRASYIPAFICSKCAQCCKGKVIALFDADILRLGTYAEASIEPMSVEETELTGAGFKMKMVGSRCVFLDGSRCQHYDLRPNTCRRHPFIITEKNVLVASTCPGIDWLKKQSGEAYAELSGEIAPKIDVFIESLPRKRRS